MALSIQLSCAAIPQLVARLATLMKVSVTKAEALAQEFLLVVVPGSANVVLQRVDGSGSEHTMVFPDSSVALLVNQNVLLGSALNTVAEYIVKSDIQSASGAAFAKIFPEMVPKKGAVVHASVDMDHGAVVNLTDATGLGQPVRGTDDGSRYLVIALGPDIKVAARALGTLSFRAVPMSDKGKELLGNSTLKPSGQGHYSIHLKGGLSPDDQKQAMGALLMQLSDGLDQILPVNRILGKGA